MKRIITQITAITLVLLFAILIPMDSVQASTSEKNKKAHKLYEKKLSSSAKLSMDNMVLYKYADLTGDGVDEVIMEYYTGQSGSDNISKIFTIKNGKAKCILSTTEYGLYKLLFYKKSKSVVYYCTGHGGESYTFYKMKKGKYRRIVIKGRTAIAGGGAENGKWNYYDAKYNSLTKSKFNTKIKGLQKGAKKTLNVGKWKTYSN